ncbi:MAG: glycosyltransferase family 4 protein [Arthrobacter sp.]|nr:glycosyltransferase family 4 protein [Arthrobacter sp.]
MANDQEPRGADHETHVAFVVNNYPPKVGGLEQHVAALAESLVERGIRTTVVTLDPGHVGTESSGPTVIRLPATRTLAGVISWPYPGTKRKLVRLLRAERVTHVSTHTRFFPMSYIGVRLARALEIPVIHTEHGSDFVSGVSPLIGLISRIVDYTLGRYILRQASLVLAISSSAQSFVQELSGRNSTLFLNAIKAGPFITSTAADADEESLVFLGRIVPGKGWECAIDTVETLHAEGRPVHLHVIGNGPDMGRLRKRVDMSPSRSRITVHGFLDSNTIAGYLRRGILINPTTLSEGFQTTLLEAIAADGAVVSTPVTAAEYLAAIGANVAVVTDGTTESFVAATRSFLVGGWPAASAQLVRNFDWSARSREYESLLSSVIR